MRGRGREEDQNRFLTYVAYHFQKTLSEQLAKQYCLNEDQSAALEKCADMFCSSHDGPPLLLIHGVPLTIQWH